MKARTTGLHSTSRSTAHARVALPDRGRPSRGVMDRDNHPALRTRHLRGRGLGDGCGRARLGNQPRLHRPSTLISCARGSSICQATLKAPTDTTTRLLVVKMTVYSIGPPAYDLCMRSTGQYPSNASRSSAPFRTFRTFLGRAWIKDAFVGLVAGAVVAAGTLRGQALVDDQRSDREAVAARTLATEADRREILRFVRDRSSPDPTERPFASMDLTG